MGFKSKRDTFRLVSKVKAPVEKLVSICVFVFGEKQVSYSGQMDLNGFEEK